MSTFAAKICKNQILNKSSSLRSHATKYPKCNFMLLFALMVSRVSRNGEIGQNFFINQVLLPPWLCVLVVLMPDFVHHFLSHHHVPRLDLLSSLLFAVSNNSQLLLITSGTQRQVSKSSSEVYFLSLLKSRTD